MSGKDTAIGVGALIALLAGVWFLRSQGVISEDLFLSGALTIVGWFVLVWLAAVQIMRSHANALDAQRALIRDQLRLSLYREVVPLIASAKGAFHVLNVRIMQFPSARWEAMRGGDPDPEAGERIDDKINDAVDGVEATINDLIGHIDAYASAYGPLRTLATDLSNASSTFQEQSYSALDVLGPDLVSGAFVNDDAFPERAQAILAETRETNMRIYTYLVDITTECHNYFLASLIGGGDKPRREAPSDRYPTLNPGTVTEPEPGA